MRVLGADNYGLVVYAQAIIQYFVIIVNFGFNISATKEISIHRDNIQKVSETVSSVIIIKVILFIVSLLALTIAVLLIPVMREHFVLFYVSMALCLSEVIFPIWFFQGIEKMRYITIINVVSRTIFAACIFVFIKHPDQYVFVPAFNGVGALVGGIIALIIVFGKEKIRFFIPKINTLWYYLKDSAPLFLTRVSTQMYVKTNTVIVGAFLGMTEVAYYDIANKVATVIKIPFQMFGQALFPKVSRDKNKVFVHRVIKLSLILVILILICVLFLSGFIFKFISGIESEIGIVVLRIMVFSAIPVIMSNFLGEQLLIPFGYKKKYTEGAVYTTVFYFVVLLILYMFNSISLFTIASLVLLTETFIAVYDVVICKKVKLI